MKPYSIIILSAIFLYGFIQPDVARSIISYPDYENIYINDYAGILDNEINDELYQYLQQAGDNNGPQITLVIIQSLGNYGAGSTIEPFATGLFNHWGVGNSTVNDGVLILVSISDRKMRIELGSGYSGNQDKVMKSIIEKSFIPYFKEDEYLKGIRIGTIETIYAITGEHPSTPSKSFIARAQFKILRLFNKLGIWLVAIIVPIIMFFVALVRKIWRLRSRSCSVCQNKMMIMDEKTDDTHLDGGQRLEEYIESVDYDVWQCHTCSRIDIFRYKGLFSSYRTCKTCNYRTLKADTTVVTAATTSYEGTKRIDYFCENCHFTNTETRSIPRRSESSSSSFGGGSSSGGGASGSW